MKVICCDDNSLHLSLIQSALRNSGLKTKPEIWKTGSSGQQAIDLYLEAKKNGVQIDLVTLDIRMPVLDGLSALVKIKSINPLQRVVMASSEDEGTVEGKSREGRDALPEREKFMLLDKVKTRVISGDFTPGKISRILDACEELFLDPIEIAKHFKANGYLHKPYKVENVKAVIEHVMSGGGFLAKVG